ncbi:MAG: hypothetical protein PHS82_12565 [Lachnospiraceae bacterium]|nr:hypothetical protein [Lachnospiraceae bacterium]
MKIRGEEIQTICGVIGISMAVVIILTALGLIFAPHLDKNLLEALFTCGMVENLALGVRYLSMKQKKGVGFILASLLLLGSMILLVI